MELLDREADYEIKETDSIENENISNEFNIKSKIDDFFLKPEKQDSSIQTSRYMSFANNIYINYCSLIFLSYLQ